MTLKKKVLLMALPLFAAGSAFAQSSPNLTYGQVPTPAQWNGFFMAKQDALNYTPLNTAGGIMSGPLTTTASIAAAAGFNISPGVAPSAPNNGDVWVTSSGIFVRVNGTTVGPLASSAGGTACSGSPSSGFTTNSLGIVTHC